MAVEIKQLIDTLAEQLGPQNWWPADSAFEMILGAILTQNTSWKNVELALANLKARELLSFEKFSALPQADLENLIRPAGFFRQKASYIKLFLQWLSANFDADLDRLKTIPLADLRPMLLAQKGIGPETADAILLYALDFPTFVVDAYTIRIFSRHNLCSPEAKYQELKALAENCLPQNAAYLNEAHALLVEVGKSWCNKNDPLCEQCPLYSML
jgi:endonuclease-3 related protein